MFEGFYKIISKTSEGNHHKWLVSFNLQHQIFQVHFPGTPITPGACQVEMFRQLAESEAGVPLCLADIRNIKYLQVIDPVSIPEVTVEETIYEPDGSGLIRCDAFFKSGDRTLTKAIIDFRR